MLLITAEKAEKCWYHGVQQCVSKILFKINSKYSPTITAQAKKIKSALMYSEYKELWQRSA